MAYSPNTSANIKITTDFGIDTKYGTALTNETIEVKASNYKNAAYQTTAVSTGDTQRGTITNNAIYKMLNVALLSPITRTYTAANGTTFQYKITSTNGTSSLSERNIIYTTTWGIGNYNNTLDYKTTLKLTTSNYNTNAITSTYRHDQETYTTHYLDLFIGTVSTPSDSTTTFSTASGKTFYVKTTFSGSNSSVTATSCTIKYTTVYGLTNSYGNTLSTDVEFKVTSKNYSSWETDLASAVSAEQAKIKNLDAYKMLNVALPSVATNTSYTATNGITYQYKVTATNGTASLTERNIVYTSTWGVGNYNNTWGTKHTLKLTTSNYSTANITTTNRTTQENNTKNYLNTLIGTFSAPTAVTETYSNAPNGITYYIKTTFSGSNTSITATSGTLTATTTWGTTSGTYDHSFTDGNTSSVSVTPSNFANRNTLVTDIGTTQRTNLKNYLNTLIGAVTTPSDSTTTFSTASGQTFYVKTTFTGSNSTEVATSCDIKYTTVYGLTNSYGTTYSSNVTFTVNASNYKTWTTNLASAVSTEQAKIKNLDAYKMLNLALPSVTTNTSFVATNGVTYQYKVTATNGTSSLTERNIIYTSTWGVGNYNNTFATKHTLKLTTSNYSTSNITTTNRTTQENNTKNYLNTLISTVTTPSDVTTTFSTASGKTFYVKTTATGSNSSITATSCTIKYTTVYGLTNSYGNTLSTDVTFTVNANNYKTWGSDYASTVASEQDKVKNLATYKMLNVALPSVVTNTNFVATNGTTYQYKVTPSYGTCNLTKSEIIYTTTWGVGNYNNTLATKHTLTLTTSNYSTSNITTTNRTTQVTNTENYLNTFIGTVSTPADITTTFSTASGKTFYVKTTATGSNSSVTNTSCTIKYTTVYGLTNSYGNTLSTDVTFTVTSSNYSSWGTDYTSVVATEQAKVKNLATYKMLNVALPSVVTNTSYTAVNGTTYQYKVTATNGTCDLTQRNIIYTTTWGVGNYNNTWGTKHTLKLTTSNYSTSNITTTNRTTQENNTKNYLDTLIGTFSAPGAVTETYSDAPNGITYYIKTTFTGGNSTVTATSATLTATTTWGTVSGTYNQSYNDSNSSSVTITINNLTDRESLIKEIGTTQRTNLKAYLDTLIGTFNTPSDRTSTFSTASGQTFYVKTTANGSNNDLTANGYVMKYTTVYGLSTSYGNTLSWAESFEVTPSNYSSWETDYASVVATEQAKVKNLDTYKMLNVALPSALTGTYTAANGITYQYKITATNGTSSLSERNIIYTTTWGVGNYNNTLATKTTLKLTTSNYSTSNITTTYRTTQETTTKNYLDTLIGTFSAPEAVTETYSDAPNGITYYIKTTFSGSNSSITATSGTLTATTTWGTTSGTYNQSYNDGNSNSVSITSNNFANRNTLVTNIGTTQRTNLKNYLNTFIGTVTTPADNTTTFSTASGQTFYVKTTATGSNSSVTATSCTIKYTTVYGLTNSYGNTLNTDVEFTVTSSNYSSWETDYASVVATEQAKVKDLDTYKMLNVALPSVLTNTSYTAANGTMYQYKVTATNGTCDLTQRNIIYTSTWGIGNYNNTLETKTTLKLTTSTYGTASTQTRIKKNTQETNTKNYLDTLVGTFSAPGAVTETYSDAPSGVTYYIKTTFTGGNSTITATSATLTATTTWGTVSGTYNQSYSDGNSNSVTITINNLADRENLIKEIGTTQRTNLKTYLDTLIGTVTKPSDVTTTFSTASGKTFYVKTTATGSNSSITATSCTIKYTTVYGLTNSYGTTLSTDVEFTITPSNYSSWATTYASTISTEQNKIKNLDTYKMLNVALPSVVTNTNFVATNTITYQYKVTATNGTCDLTQRNIVYTSTWGIGNYNNTWGTKTTLKLTTSNYSTSNITTTNRTTQETATKNYLNTLIGTFSAPSQYTETYVNSPSGVTYYIKTTFSGSNASITATSGTLTATTTWGTVSGTYNQSYSDGNSNSVSITPSNFSTRNTLVADIGTTQRSNLKNYLDTLIGTVTTPADSTTTFSTASGQTFYVKTTFTGGNTSITATSCVIKYTTVYGLTNSYGTTLSTDVTFTVNANNYKTWTTDIASAVSTEQAKVKNLDSYKMLNVALPGVLTNTNFVATNGLTYQYKVTATNGICDLTQRNIIYTSTWGVGNYNNTLATKHTLKLTTSNYSTANITTTNRTTQENNTKNYLNTLIGTFSAPSQYTETYVNSPSGVTYYIKTVYTGGNSTVTATSATLTATTTWGTVSGTYNQSYDDGNSSSVSITSSNFANRENIVKEIGSTQRSNLKNYLDTLIGVVVKPVDKTTTFSTASGQTFYVKTTFSGGNTSVTATGTTITYTTVYGLTNSYGTTLSTDVEFVVTPDNYTTWESEIATAVSTEQNKVKNLDSYKMLNIVLPSAHSDTYTAVNGKTYSFTTTYTQGTADLTQNNITCTTKYTRQDKTVKTYNSTTRKFTTSDYSTASTNLASDMSTLEQNLKDYLDTLLVMPSKYTNTYTKGGCKYYFEIYYTIPDEESHDVTATAKVDLLTLKSSTVTCTNMSDFNTKKTSMQSTKISEMQNAVSDSPLNTSTSVQGLTITTYYTKNVITSSSVDGSIYGGVNVEGSMIYGPINFGKLTKFTNYKFVYTTIVNNINAKVSEITNLLNNSLPVSGSYTYQSTDNFGCDISYTYTRNVLLYSLSISIDGVDMHNETQYLNINEAFKIESRMRYLLAKYESMIKNVTPVDIEQTYNGVTVARKFSKNPSSNKVTCELYVDGVKKYTYTGTFDLSQSLLKENLQSLGEGDYNQYLSNAKSLNISVSTTTTITSNGKNYNVYILTEKVGSKIRVYRVIGNMKTNYIDVDINYLNASTTKTAIQTAANKLISNLNTAIDFYRPPSEAALVELLKVITV